MFIYLTCLRRRILLNFILFINIFNDLNAVHVKILTKRKFNVTVSEILCLFINHQKIIYCVNRSFNFIKFK